MLVVVEVLLLIAEDLVALAVLVEVVQVQL
jgi:hypothetical protein